MPEHPNERAPQSLFNDQLWQEICKLRPRKWSRDDVGFFTRTLIATLAGALGSGYTVEFRNFGIFRIVSTNAVQRRIPSKRNSEMIVPPRCKLIFCPTKSMKKRVLRLTSSLYPRGKTRAERGDRVRRP